MIKILYGLMSDNVPICGSRRKAYLFILAVMNFVSLYVASISTSNQSLTTFCLLISSLSVAFSDVVVDALSIIQSRRSPEDGSE